MQAAKSRADVAQQMLDSALAKDKGEKEEQMYGNFVFLVLFGGKECRERRSVSETGLVPVLQCGSLVATLVVLGGWFGGYGKA